MSSILNKKLLIYFYGLLALAFYFSGVLSLLMPLPFMLAYYLYGKQILKRILLYFFFGFFVFIAFSFFLSKISSDPKNSFNITTYEILYVISICISTYTFLLSSSRWPIRLLKVAIFPALITFFQIHSLRLGSTDIVSGLAATLVEAMPQIKEEGNAQILINTALSFVMLVTLSTTTLFLLMNRYFTILILQRKFRFSLHHYFNYVYEKIITQMNRSHFFLFLISLGTVLMFRPHMELKTLSFTLIISYISFNVLLYTLFCYFIYGGSLVYMYIQKHKSNKNMFLFIFNAHWYFFIILGIIVIPVVNFISIIGFISIGLVNNIFKI